MEEKDLKENQMIVIDNEDKEHVVEIYFTYESKRTGKNFVFFFEEDNEDEVIVMQENEDGTLDDVEDEEDYKEVQEVFEAFQNDVEEAE